jgi:hypothetical protein
MRFRRPLALLVGLSALGALLLGAFAAAQFRSATLGRPWFVNPSQLVVAADGTLYVGIGETEIQVYAADGAPRSAWHRSPPGPFALRLPEGGEAGIEVVSADDQVRLVDPDGARRGERGEPGAFSGVGEPRREGAAVDGARYALRSEGLVRSVPEPARVLVPAPPRPLAWFGARPLLPVMFVLIASLLGLVACVALTRRNSEAS